MAPAPLRRIPLAAVLLATGLVVFALAVTGLGAMDGRLALAAQAEPAPLAVGDCPRERGTGDGRGVDWRDY